MLAALTGVAWGDEIRVVTGYAPLQLWLIGQPARSLYAAIPLLAATIAGCSSGGTRLEPARAENTQPTHRITTSGANDSRPAAMVGGAGLSRDAMWPALAEAAGGVVLEEAALELLLDERCRREGIRIDDAAIERERALLLQSLSDDPNEAVRLLGEVRRRRGLGDSRFASLLRRNAMLRALVRPQVRITEGMALQAYQLRHGPRIGARLIITPTLDEANEALARIRAGASFGEVAASLSNDPSASRGGLIEPLSPADPAYPQGVRTALERLQVGQVSPPVAIERGFAILRREPATPRPAPPPFEQVRGEAERDARVRQERILMEELASSTLRAASITAFDPSLSWSWSQTTNR